MSRSILRIAYALSEKYKKATFVMPQLLLTICALHHYEELVHHSHLEIVLVGKPKGPPKCPHCARGTKRSPLSKMKCNEITHACLFLSSKHHATRHLTNVIFPMQTTFSLNLRAVLSQSFIVRSSFINMQQTLINYYIRTCYIPAHLPVQIHAYGHAQFKRDG